MADPAVDDKPTNAAAAVHSTHEQASSEANPVPEDAMDLDEDAKPNTTVNETTATSRGNSDSAPSQPHNPELHAERDSKHEVQPDADTKSSDEAKADPTADQKPESQTKTEGGAEADVDADADGDPTEGRQTPSRLDNDMLNVIENVANYLTAYKDDDGYYIASHFQRIPNRRLVPDYHEVIKEPTAFSTVRTKKLKKQYTAFSEFVRDVALISHNAQVYNRPSSQVFKDALRLREIFQEELQKLVEDEIISAEDAVLPDLGEIPEADDSPDEEEDEEMEEEDDDEDEDDEDDEESSSDDDDDDSRGRHRRKGREDQTYGSRAGESQKTRGRPPKVFTPVEARIYSLLQGLRKLKHPNGDLLIYPFERLPDKSSNPDYYTTIANPIALDIIKKKYKRKKYQTVDQAMQDIDMMFENAKEYNIETSQLYKDAVQLQNHARELAEQEKTRPDNDFEDENGRRPVAEIYHRGETWRVGDWVHITNANDLTKPIIAQIYRTWQDRQGQQWVNACWYYRPEQTVHRHDKFFFMNEVVKTGQYRDHRIDEVVDRCFVMFVTRYDKGRPRGFPRDKEVYICKSRYNEENHRLNKIKTWTTCLPDEVREKDYEMDLFDVPRSLKKIPSPIKHLLRYDAKATDPLPKPTWGAPNAPPLVGAVHCREREPNESPPPESLTAPVPAPIEPIRRQSTMQTTRPVDGQGDISMSNTGHFSTIPAQPAPATNGHTAPAYTAHYTPRPSATPVPVPQYGAHTFQSAHVPTPQMPPQAPPYQSHPPHQTHQNPAYNGFQSQYTPTPVPMPPQPHHVPPNQMTNPIVPYDPSQRLAPSPARGSVVPVPSASTHVQANAYNPPRPIEVYKLDDATNASVPADVREQFLRDEAGNVLFFTQPPLDRVHRGVSNEHANLGHSVRYLADRARQVTDRRAKRKARDEMRKEEEAKRLASEQEAAETEKQQQIDSAAKIFLGWAQSIQDEADVLEASYGGWGVNKNNDIDAV
ncbi:hypothetical protein F5B22DRAFT_629545 [Xylaria bambusicola]|uniref:uncharacterized protein n=1 Tax=Xylaria bambusicola TaxID=326684 RepID=UPI0020084011|nr:uncharacterized protein F5B22DRAFT_629545 [Xylaria bambusicola]KAI0503320.1 hypothetical protein F5B22DRAFT_629545 [Xylaria bambusicola]